MVCVYFASSPSVLGVVVDADAVFGLVADGEAELFGGAFGCSGGNAGGGAFVLGGLHGGFAAAVLQQRGDDGLGVFQFVLFVVLVFLLFRAWRLDKQVVAAVRRSAFPAN